MTSVYLVRHAQAVGNVEQRFQGHTDHPLTPLGREQAALVGRRFRSLPVDVVYASPLQRAVDTARYIGAPHHLEPVVHPGLLEIAGGALENMSFVQLEAEYPLQYHSFALAPHEYTAVGDGETHFQVYDRMRDTVQELVSRHTGQTMVLASHGSALRCLLCWAMGLDLSQMQQVTWVDNTAVSHLIFVPGRELPDIAFAGDVSHLPVELRS